MNFEYKKTSEKRKELTSLKRKFSTKILVKTLKICIYLCLTVAVIGGFFVIGMAKGIIDNAPSVDNISIAPSGNATTIYDNKGKEIEKLLTAGSNRVSVSLEKIPDHLKWAFICIEDERFYEHKGIDLKGILRAGYVAITTRDLSEGASTITQQLLKNNIFSDWESEQSLGTLFKRKIQEQYLAVQLEKNTPKDAILTSYLNTINLGSNTLGVQTASMRYFKKNVEDLTLSESTVIASITQNPYKFNPIRFPESNAGRREKILNNMLRMEKITQEEFDEALKDDVYSRIQKVDAEIGETSPYSYFVDELTKQVINDLMDYKGYSYTQAHNALYSGGLSVYTTQDSKIQKICDKEIMNDSNFPSQIRWSINWNWSVQRADGTVENFSEGYITYYHKTVLKESAFKLLFWDKKSAKQCVEDYKKAMLKKGDKVLGEKLSYTVQPQISFTVMDQATGYVKAIVGGRGKKTASLTLNRATNTTRQPGSTFKPIGVYAPAIDSKGYTLSTAIKDEPYTYSNGRPVSNWWGDYYKGWQTVRTGIAQSMNILAVKTITDITPELSFQYLQDFGITTLVGSRKLANGSTVSDINQSLALGGITDGVKNIELCAAFAAVANGGVYTKPVYYTKVVDHSGKILLDNTTPATHTVVKPTTAYYLTEAMQDVVNGKGTGTAAAIKDIPVAGKTGTTSNEYDLWFAGYTPYLTAVIWTGYDENTPMGNGVWHNALWSKIMTKIHDSKKYSGGEFPVPDALVGVDICTESGKLAIEGQCPSIQKEYFAEDAAPTSKCTLHSAANKDALNESETTKKGKETSKKDEKETSKKSEKETTTENID